MLKAQDGVTVLQKVTIRWAPSKDERKINFLSQSSKIYRKYNKHQHLSAFPESSHRRDLFNKKIAKFKIYRSCIPISFPKIIKLVFDKFSNILFASKHPETNSNSQLTILVHSERDLAE